MDRLEARAEGEGEPWGIWIFDDATKEQIADGHYFTSPEKVDGAVEVWNTDDGKLI